MKFRLIVDPRLLKPHCRLTLARSLLVLPSQAAQPDFHAAVADVRDLLKYAFESLSFALQPEAADPSELFLATEDGFLLPPNARIDCALEDNQVIRMSSVKAPAVT